MKKSLLSSLLENKAFQVPIDEFVRRAEHNPFSRRSPVVIAKRDEEDPEMGGFEDDYDDFEANVDGMDDFVRRSNRRGLDVLSRSHTGDHSGVYASRYDGMVRDIDDITYDDGEEYDDDLDHDFDPAIRSYDDEHFDSRSDKDALYLTTRDRSYKRNEFNQDSDIFDIELDAGKEFMRQLDADAVDTNPNDDFDPEMGDEDKMDDEVVGDEEMDDEFSDLDPEMDEEDPRYEGIVRAVKGAYLVSKTQQPNETFTEVWIYNVGDEFDDEANIRKNILAATDIDPTKGFSEDGSQEAIIKTVGNVQFLTLNGLQD